MTYKEIVTLVKTISETINLGGSFFHGRTYDTTLEFGAVYPQIHLYPFTMQPDQSNYNIIRSELLIAFWNEDGHENTMEQREDIIAAMDDLCVLFEAAIRATENVQVLSFRKEPQYLSQMGVVSGIACNISLHSAVLCVAPSEQPPVNLTLPLITGLNTLGATLSGSNGTWSGNPDTFTYTYQWKRNGVNIPGATNNTYVTTVLDSEANITFEVTASNGVSPNGVATSLAVTMDEYTPVNTLAPVISGVLELGEILTSTNGTWTNSPNIFAYQWFRNGIEILGATSSTYALSSSDQEKNITLVVYASNGLVGSQVSNTLAIPSFATPPVFAVAPQITGTAVVDQTLTCDGGTVTGTPTPTKTYQWYRGVNPISGATNSTYTLVQADAGNTSNMKCVVTATNGAGSVSADSNTVVQVLDANANTYLVNSTNDGNATFVSAINQFVIDLKTNSLWTKMRRVYPFLGGNSAKCATDLVTGVNGTFGGTFTYSANGPLPNGTNAFFDTGLNATSLTANNNHLSFDSFTNNAVTIDYDMGVATSATSGINLLDLFFRRSNGTCAFDGGTFPNGRVSSTTTDSAAYFIGSIVSNNDRRIFRNATQLNISTTTFNQTLANGNIYIFAINNLTPPLSGATTYGSKGSKLATIGDGLTAAEVNTLQTIRSTFQTAVGR